MKSVLISIALLLVSMGGLKAQDSNLWKTLSKITFKQEYDKLLGFNVDYPVFSKETLALEGKEVSVKGYIVPINGYKSHKEFIFSAFPFSQCFFCGGAGPETVMEIEALEGVKYTTEPIVLKGILHTNAKDINRLMYKLVKVKLIN